MFDHFRVCVYITSKADFLSFLEDLRTYTTILWAGEQIPDEGSITSAMVAYAEDETLYLHINDKGHMTYGSQGRYESRGEYNVYDYSKGVLNMKEFEPYVKRIFF